MPDMLTVPAPCTELWAKVLPREAYTILATMPTSYVFSLYPVEQRRAQRILIDQIVDMTYGWLDNAEAIVNHFANAWQESSIPSLSTMRYLADKGGNDSATDRLSIIEVVERFGYDCDVVTKDDEVVNYGDWLDTLAEPADEYEMLRQLVRIPALLWTSADKPPWSDYERWQADQCVLLFLRLVGDWSDTYDEDTDHS